MRIGIVNDVPIVVELLRRIVDRIPDYEVAWIAINGKEAVDMCARDVPDIILMDLLMPVMDGVEATRIIMQNTPCIILIVTASVTSNLSKVYQAMGYGALDVVKTPSGDKHEVDELLRKISNLEFLIGKKKPVAKEINQKSKERVLTISLPPLVVIGASTGGPMALSKILSTLPKDFEGAIVIVQHVNEQFTQGLAEWLGKHTVLPVELAQSGARPAAGKVLLAGVNDHLTLTSHLNLEYTSKPIDNPFRPSVDVFFNSVAEHWPNPCLAILLTGIGEDGAHGMKHLNEVGWYTIAEHKSTCVIYGMPRAAIELGAVSQVLKLDEIGPSVNSFIKTYIKNGK